MIQPSKFVYVSTACSSDAESMGDATVIISAIDEDGRLWYKYINTNMSHKIADEEWILDKGKTLPE